VREDDPQWAAIVRWVMEALIAAEEHGRNAGQCGSDAQARGQRSGAAFSAGRLTGDRPGAGAEQRLGDARDCGDRVIMVRYMSAIWQWIGSEAAARRE